jgi:CHASE3 domain sensor protein
VVLLLSAAKLLGDSVSALRETYSSVQTSNSALLDIAEINTLIMGIDMSVRGYALTDNPVFRRYERNNRERLDITINRLTRLASSNQSANIAHLRALVAKQEALFLQLVNLGPGHAKEVAAAIVDPEKRKIRYAAQDTLTAIHAGEMKLLSERQQAVERQVSRTFFLALGIAVFAFVAGVLGVALTFFSRRQRPAPQFGGG